MQRTWNLATESACTLDYDSGGCEGTQRSPTAFTDECGEIVEATGKTYLCGVHFDARRNRRGRGACRAGPYGVEPAVFAKSDEAERAFTKPTLVVAARLGRKWNVRGSVAAQVRSLIGRDEQSRPH